jgi:hypothetical protein
MLNEFYASLPPCIMHSLNTTPSRYLHPFNVESMNTRGRALWKQMHYPVDKKLEHKLAHAHPDLSIYIIHSVYGGLFTNPENLKCARIGRITMSLSAIACLRAQHGVGPQLLGHFRGLKKTWKDESWKSEPHVGGDEAIRWFVSDEGCIWVLEKIDELSKALSVGQGSTFAPIAAKL